MATSDGATADTLDITIAENDRVSSAPQSLAAAAGDAQLTLTWVTPSDNGTSDITGYEYRISSSALADDDTWEAISGSDGSSTSATITTLANSTTNLVNGTKYYVELRAVSVAGKGAAAATTGTPSS